jgi:hypothetical protein
MPLLSHVTASAGRTGRLSMSQPGGGKESVSHAADTLARHGLQTQRPTRQSEQSQKSGRDTARFKLRFRVPRCISSVRFGAG